MKLFVIITAAIPVGEKMNCVATKISHICSRASRADYFEAIAKEKPEDIVYGLKCKLHARIVPIDLIGDMNGNEVYIITSVAIPKKRGENPSQLNVYKALASKSDAEQEYNRLLGESRDKSIKNQPCEIQYSIVIGRVDLT